MLELPTASAGGHPGGHIRGSMGSEQGEDAWWRNRNMIVSMLCTRGLIWLVVSSLLYLNHHTAVALNRTAPNSLINPRIAHLFTPIVWQSCSEYEPLPVCVEHGEHPHTSPHSAKTHLILFVSSEDDFVSLISFLSWLWFARRKTLLCCKLLCALDTTVDYHFLTHPSKRSKSKNWGMESHWLLSHEEAVTWLF